MEIRRIIKHDFVGASIPFDLRENLKEFANFLGEKYEVELTHDYTISENKKYQAEYYSLILFSLNLIGSEFDRYYFITVSYRFEHLKEEAEKYIENFFNVFSFQELIQQIDYKKPYTIARLVNGTHSGFEVNPEIHKIVEKALLSTEDPDFIETILVELQFSNYILPLKEVFAEIEKKVKDENVQFMLSITNSNIEDLEEQDYREEEDE
ncbi:hypothetical protein [Spirochaeta cellobiosiphila]|uniref:hypothetical protein n=1 Tax=Spirochaeta cellobiosiphila TaxID=504483 RepID=UPI00041FB1A0|nr:hypothetical protein [Spirochaeta cellobiosiphila]